MFLVCSILAGFADGPGDHGSQIPRMLGPHAERPQDGVRRSHPCRSMPAKSTQEKEGLSAFVTFCHFFCCRLFF